MAGFDTMLAARYPTSGPDLGTLSVTEMSRPKPGPGEVLVRVRVSGVKPTDWKSRRSGANAGVADEIVPNQDGAGEVVAVGDGVDPARVGERVWLWEGSLSGRPRKYSADLCRSRMADGESGGRWRGRALTRWS